MIVICEMKLTFLFWIDCFFFSFFFFCSENFKSPEKASDCNHFSNDLSFLFSFLFSFFFFLFLFLFSFSYILISPLLFPLSLSQYYSRQMVKNAKRTMDAKDDVFLDKALPLDVIEKSPARLYRHHCKCHSPFVLPPALILRERSPRRRRNI